MLLEVDIDIDMVRDVNELQASHSMFTLNKQFSINRRVQNREKCAHLLRPLSTASRLPSISVVYLERDVCWRQCIGRIFDFVYCRCRCTYNARPIL